MLAGYSQFQILLAMATAIGAAGGFPPVPEKMAELQKRPIVQWALAFALIWQGGGAQDLKLSLLATFLLYLLYQAMA